MSLNCQSIKNKTLEVLNYLEDCNTHIACFQETWLSSANKSVYQHFKDFGFKTLKRERLSGKGGGIAILYDPSLKLKPMTNYKADKFVTFEYLCCSFMRDNQMVLLVNLYRLPYSAKHRYTVKQFLDEFEKLMSDLIIEKGSVLLCGDFNIDWKADNSNCTRFKTMLTTYNLLQLVNENTHIKGGMLDLLIMDESLLHENTLVKIDSTFKTDHFPVVLNLPSVDEKRKNDVILKSVRELHNFDIVKFSEALKDEDLTNPSFVSGLDTAEAISLYNSTLARLLNKQCPLVTKRYRLKYWKSRWYNSLLKELKRKKRAAERKYRKDPCVKNRDNLKCFRNKYNYELKTAREQFYHRKLTENARDSKQLFGLVKQLTGTKKEKILPTSRSKHIIAEEMANFYTNKIEKIREAIISTRTVDEMESSESSQSRSYKFEMFKTIDHDELKQIISEMKSKTSRNDPIGSALVKQSFDLLAPVLLRIINSCIENNVFPDELKKAIITPVIKDETKDPDDFQNYRPISNLEFLSKLLERVMFKQLTSYCETFDLFTKFQSAYKTNHSCETAMTYVIDDIQEYLGSKLNVALTMLDLSSAFDTVDHQLLLDRLERKFGISDGALKLIKSYLCQRTFSVLVDDEVSSPHKLRYGVPQGSILGPLFYCMYTGEIETIVKNHGLKVHLYADDCTIYFPFGNGDEAAAKIKLSKCVKDIQIWMKNSFLKLNREKTKLMVFRPNAMETESFSLVDTNNEIFTSKTGKLLGVTLGTSMNFTEFITKKIQTCNFHLRNLRAVRSSIPQSTRILLVTSFICSTVDYCNTLLVSVPKYLTDRLQKTLNSAVRFIYNVRKRDHITPYLKQLHILPVIYRIKFKITSIAFKITRGIAPVYLNDKVKMFTPSTSISLRHGCGRDKWMFDSDVSVQKSSNLISKMIVEWNKLPLSLRKLESFDVFKTNLKTFYFKKAFKELS